MITSELIATLDPPGRLALAYTPAALRDRLAVVLLLDARMAAIVRRGGEEMLREIRLAWWRERLTEDPLQWPKGEPLLIVMSATRLDGKQLTALVDGWEALIGSEALSEARVEQFADGRVRALMSASAATPEIASLVREWALTDLAIHLTDDGERRLVLKHLSGERPRSQKISRDFRGLAVMAALAHGALRDHKRGRRISAAALLAAVRAGWFGR